MSQEITKDAIAGVLKQVVIPYLAQDLISTGCVEKMQWNPEKKVIEIHLRLNFKSIFAEADLIDVCKAQLMRAFGVDVTVTVQTQVLTHKVQNGLKPLKNIKNIIVVASGKGGVGKSTTAVNIAMALQKEGGRVGMLDADIYGPSLPKMLGCKDRPQSLDSKTMEPVMAQGLQTMSIGYLLDEQDAAIWRAPMAISALTQLLEETNWKDLDYLIIDMPPGTGDIQLTLAQKIPVAGSVIVTTPQDIALIDARKGIDMFQKVEVPILGIVENMSTHICSHCQHEEPIFGTDGGSRLAADTHVPLLGKLPLHLAIRQSLDAGTPQAMSDKEIVMRYRDIAIKIVATLSLRPKDMAGKFPNIVVETK